LYSSALQRYDWFIEHVFLWPYYFTSDRIWDLINLYLSRKEEAKRTNVSDAIQYAESKAKLENLEGMVSHPN